MPDTTRPRATANRLGLLLIVALAAVLIAGCVPRPPAPPPLSIPHGAPSGGPVITAFSCPITGARYGEGFGPQPDGSFHYGIDLLAPIGTPLVAVMAGSVHYVANESGGGGNAVYLTGVDGNVYYYAHLVSFVGGDRRVGDRELIGYVGQSGNATTPHLHFQIRLGGANGTRVDPSATLRAHGC
jgi:murein DD-endopeptidase MepM/ murein hydrolase activator NlpD